MVEIIDVLAKNKQYTLGCIVSNRVYIDVLLLTSRTVVSKLKIAAIKKPFPSGTKFFIHVIVSFLCTWSPPSLTQSRHSPWEIGVQGQLEMEVAASARLGGNQVQRKDTAAWNGQLFQGQLFQGRQTWAARGGLVPTARTIAQDDST